MSRLGELLRIARGKASRDDLAEKLEVHRNTLARFEKGTHSPDLDFLVRFCAVTGTSFADLLRVWLEESDTQGADAALRSLGPFLGVSFESFDGGVQADLDRRARERAGKYMRSVPVTRLARANEAGWHAQERVEISMAVPADVFDPDAFGVVSSADIAGPGAVPPGALCVCSPNTDFSAGSLVYIERGDGLAAFRAFAEIEQGQLSFRVWRPDQAGHWALETERLSHDDYRRISAVIWIKVTL